MEDDKMTCAKCGGEMSAGYVLNLGLPAAAGPSTWQEGDPEPSFWTGVKHFGKAKHPVTVYRCTACGYLESYAR
jgi:DNA-directed RNA polymerase subunit M/transcription elongation factor TFIIS